MVRRRSLFVVSDGWASFRAEGFLEWLSSSDDISRTSLRRIGVDDAAFFLRVRLDVFLDGKVPLDGGSSSSEDKIIISLLEGFDGSFVSLLPDGAAWRVA